MRIDLLRRRDFITLLSGAATPWSLAAWAQQPERVARVGYLGLMSPAFDRVYGGGDLFADALRDLGYVEGRNIHIEFRYAEGHEDRLPRLATELVDLNVDVIVTYATGANAAHRATAIIPIVAATAGDMVAMGIVASLAHPGGNITGSTFFVPELYAKRLELLREVVPSMTRAGVLLVRDNPSNLSILEAMRTAAKALKAELHPIEVRGPAEYESAFSTWAGEKISALVVSDHAQFLANIDAIAALAAKHRFPSIGPLEFPASGGLMAYGVNFSVMFRRAAAFVDRILKGAKPGDIPIEQATKFKFILNLKAANTLGLDIPPMLSARADEVIE